jgi:hypothetical protein
VVSTDTSANFPYDRRAPNFQLVGDLVTGVSIESKTDESSSVAVIAISEQPDDRIFQSSLIGKLGPGFLAAADLCQRQHVARKCDRALDQGICRLDSTTCQKTVCFQLEDFGGLTDQPAKIDIFKHCFGEKRPFDQLFILNITLKSCIQISCVPMGLRAFRSHSEMRP